MNIYTSNSQQTSRSFGVMIDGVRHNVATASCQVRPGKGMTISMDIHDLGSLNTIDGVFEDVAQAFASYLAEEIPKAVSMDIPVALPGM